MGRLLINMPCYGCARNFSFMTREYGCVSCGFAFCSSCLKNKTCRKCLSQKSPTKTVPHNSAVLEKKLFTLENPNKSPITVYKQTETRFTSLKRGLSLEDQALVDRLSKLKAETINRRDIPSQHEIEDRLAKLKGISPDVYRKPPVFIKPSNPNIDPVTQLLNQVAEESAIDLQSDHPQELYQYQKPSHDEDEVEMLLRKACAAAEIEAKMEMDNLNKDKEIQQRMKNLKIGRREATENESISDDSDEDQQATKIIEKALAENRLAELDDGFSTDLKMEDELPWCELCNEDAQLRCVECDGDLYCRRCWKETHRDPELKQHHIENYTPPK